MAKWKERERERKQKETEIEKKRRLGTSSFFYRYYVRSRRWCPYGTEDASNVQKSKQQKGFASLRGISSDLDAEAGSPRLFLTRRRLVLSSCCSVYLEARNNSNCNCLICEGLGCKEYEYRTESFAGMITWLIPWLVANDRFYLIKRRAIRLDEIGQTFQSSSYASLVWRRTQDTLCIQTNYLS